MVKLVTTVFEEVVLHCNGVAVYHRAYKIRQKKLRQNTQRSADIIKLWERIGNYLPSLQVLRWNFTYFGWVASTESGGKCGIFLLIIGCDDRKGCACLKTQGLFVVRLLNTGCLWRMTMAEVKVGRYCQWVRPLTSFKYAFDKLCYVFQRSTITNALAGFHVKRCNFLRTPQG